VVTQWNSATEENRLVAWPCDPAVQKLTLWKLTHPWGLVHVRGLDDDAGTRPERRSA
jgi:hypothetical protein